MIRFTSKTDVTPLDSMMDFLDSILDEMQDIADDVVNETKPTLLKELGETPPKRNYPSQYPIEWTSDKQRKAYFATNGFEAGIPYKRTGNLTKSWTVVGIRKGNRIELIVENTQGGAQYVFGSLAQDIQTASSFQQQFHAITGWELASPKVQKWADEAEALIFQQLRERIGKIDSAFSRRAFTSRGRRRR